MDIATKYDESVLHHSRSSSPFVSEITTSSRSPSKHYNQHDRERDMYEDKENVPQSMGISKKEFIPPSSKRLSPSKQHIQHCQERDGLGSSDLPKKEIIKSAGTSSPFKASQSGCRDHIVDDTCFSNFSEIPDLLDLTKTAQSPFARVDALLNRNAELTTPRTSRKRCSPSRSPSPTPRRIKTPKDNTSFLIDFTQQIEDLGQAGRLPTSRTEPDLLQHLNRQRSPGKIRQSTPAKQSNILNLLDFELPPAPTPRSVPTITVRELETLKSQYLSQISSLKATLSGREAEVESLKKAIGDAERRVGDAQQSLKEERNRREHAEQERSDWERRGLDVENVLNNVREEVLKSEAEREELVQKMDDYEKRLSAAATTCEGVEVEKLVALQLDAKIEAVSRELHAVYKEKHERKVATLKKSYEARSEKRCAEMQAQLQQHNVDTELKVHFEEQKAQLARVEEELLASQTQQEGLMQALEQERIEKGDLVAAVDEMLALQNEPALSIVEEFRKSISRPGSSLRRPSESRIGRIPSVGRTPAKSKMLANIERMGRSTIAD